MNNNQIVLLELIKAAMFGIDPVLPGDVDWDALLREAESQTVTGLVASKVPSGVVGKWKTAAARSEASFLRVLHGQKRLVQLLEDAGIPLVILKGTAAAMYYPAPCRRMMGDVDFLVPQDRFEQAARLMEKNGYRPFGDLECQVNAPVRPRHIEFGRDGVEYELHHHFSMNFIQIEDTLISGLLHAETGWVYNVSFPVLPTLENGLLLLAHACFHLTQGELGLRQVIDWMMYVHRELDDATWANSFSKMAEDAGLKKLAAALTRLCRDWLGLPGSHGWCEEADEETDEETVTELLDLVMKKGNFGRKLENPHKVENIAAKIGTRGFFPYLMQTAGNVWNSGKVSGSNRVLRPFVWTKEFGNLLSRRLTARPTHLVEEIRSGDEMSRLFKKLEIQ